jgi:hypothetical protein
MKKKDATPCVSGKTIGKNIDVQKGKSCYVENPGEKPVKGNIASQSKFAQYGDDIHPV